MDDWPQKEHWTKLSYVLEGDEQTTKVFEYKLTNLIWLRLRVFLNGDYQVLSPKGHAIRIGNGDLYEAMEIAQNLAHEHAMENMDSGLDLLTDARDALRKTGWM